MPVGVAGKFQEDRVAASRKFQSGRSVSIKFVVDENFGAVRLRGNRDCADALGRSGGRGVRRLGRGGAFTGRRLDRGWNSSLARGSDVWVEAVKNFEQIGGAESEADAGDVFLDQILRVDADDFAAGIEKRDATVTGIADVKNIFALADTRGTGKRKMRELDFSRGELDFGERDVQVRINVHDFGFELLAGGKKRKQRFFPTGEMRVGHDDASAGDEE